MATHEDGNLILKLYELRREDKLREAREWFAGKFQPQSIEDITEAMASEHSAHLRMVISYWDMAAALVNHGAIDRDLFYDASGEQYMVYAKIQPFLEEMRQTFGNPRMLSSLEKLVKDAPHGEEAVARWQSRWKAAATAKETAAKA